MQLLVGSMQIKMVPLHKVVETVSSLSYVCFIHRAALTVLIFVALIYVAFAVAGFSSNAVHMWGQLVIYPRCCWYTLLVCRIMFSSLIG